MIDNQTTAGAGAGAESTGGETAHHRHHRHHRHHHHRPSWYSRYRNQLYVAMLAVGSALMGAALVELLSGRNW